MSERFTPKVAVFVIIKNERGEILLQQRAGKYLAGYYDFASSGHLEKGETLQESAVRELFEEIAVTADPKDLRLIHIDQYSLEEEYINFTFVADIWSGVPIINEPDKCSDLSWFAINKLPEKCVNNLRAVERAGFGSELNYSFTDNASYEALMGVPFNASSKKVV